MKAIDFREKYNNDFVFREKIKTKARDRYNTDPDYKQRTIENAKNRYRRLKEGQ